MKKRKGKGGAIRLFILIFLLAAAAAGARMAAGTVETMAAATEDAGQSTSAPDAAGGQDATAAAAEEDSAYDHLATELEKGRAYLLSLEERTPVEMEYMIAEARKAREKEIAREEYSRKREAYRNTLKDDKLWDSFEDYVFLGDSRVVGYDVFGYLPSERVLAEAGDTINSISDNMDTIRELSPKYIFISYGINDIGIGYWPTKEEYAAAFADKLHDLQKAVPDAQMRRRHIRSGRVFRTTARLCARCVKKRGSPSLTIAASLRNTRTCMLRTGFICSRNSTNTGAKISCWAYMIMKTAISRFENKCGI